MMKIKFAAGLLAVAAAIAAIAAACGATTSQAEVLAPLLARLRTLPARRKSPASRIRF
jgi:hypothetical protein